MRTLAVIGGVGVFLWFWLGGLAAILWLVVSVSAVVFSSRSVTKFDGHILEGAILHKQCPDKVFEVKLLSDGSLIEYWPGKPDDHWGGTWRLHDNGNFVIQVGQYRSIYYPTCEGGVSSPRYPGEEDGRKMLLFFAKEGGSLLDKFLNLFSSGSTPTKADSPRSSPTFPSHPSPGDWRTKADRENERQKAQQQRELEESLRKYKERERVEQAQREEEGRLRRVAEDKKLRSMQENWRCSVCGVRAVIKSKFVQTGVSPIRGGQNSWSGGCPTGYTSWNSTNTFGCKKCGKWVCRSDNCQRHGICRRCSEKL